MVSTRRMQASHNLQEAQNESMSAVLCRLRAAVLDEVLPVSQRHAAVLVPLYKDAAGIVQVLLTQRAASLSSHAGEVCLPGGKRDETDTSDAHTALREAHEELGLPPRAVQIITLMPPVLSKHLISVVPVIGVVTTEHAERAMEALINPAEVQCVFPMPLRLFLQQDGHSSQDAVMVSANDGLHPDIPYRLHFFQLEDWPVCWGLTAGILIEVAKLGFGREPQFEENPPGCRAYSDIWYNGEQVLYRNNERNKVKL